MHFRHKTSQKKGGGLAANTEHGRKKKRKRKSLFLTMKGKTADGSATAEREALYLFSQGEGEKGRKPSHVHKKEDLFPRIPGGETEGGKKAPHVVVPRKRWGKEKNSSYSEMEKKS